MNQQRNQLRKLRIRIRTLIREKAALWAAVLLAGISLWYAGRETVYYVTGENVNVGDGKWCVVIDAGHGGGYLRHEKFPCFQVDRRFGNRWPETVERLRAGAFLVDG